MSDQSRIPEPKDFHSLLAALTGSRDAGGSRLRPEDTAVRRATRAGKSIEETIAEDRARLRNSKYPGPDCLEPYEVERYFIGALSPERREHAEACVGCSTLLHAATPSESGAEVIIEEVQQLSKLLASERADQPVPVRKSRLPRWRRRGFVTDFLFPILPVLASVSAVILLFQTGAIFPEPPEIGLGFITNRPAVTVTVLAGIIVTFAFIFWGARSWSFALRTSGGGLVAGCLLAIVVGSLLTVLLDQRASQTELGLNLVSDRLARVAAASLDIHDSTGKFPLVKDSTGTLVLTTVFAGEDQAEYRAHTESLGGAVIANIGANGGAVYWKQGGKSQRLARLVRGTIDAVSSDSIVVRSVKGMVETIKVPVDPAFELKVGEQIVARVDRQNTALAVYPVASVARIIPTAEMATQR